MTNRIYFHERFAELWSKASAAPVFVPNLLLGDVIRTPAWHAS